jgi:hypothetical protein
MEISRLDPTLTGSPLTWRLSSNTTSVRQIVDVQELSKRRSRAPELHGLRPSFLRFVHPSHKRGDHVRVLRVEIVVRSVEVARHYREELLAMLPVVGLCQLEPGDLGDRIGFVGCLPAVRLEASPPGLAVRPRADRCSSNQAKRAVRRRSRARSSAHSPQSSDCRRGSRPGSGSWP